MPTTSRTFLAQALCLALFPVSLALAAAPAGLPSSDASASTARQSGSQDTSGATSSGEASSQDTHGDDGSSTDKASTDKASNDESSTDGTSNSTASNDGASSDTSSADDSSSKPSAADQASDASSNADDTTDATADIGSIDDVLRAQVLLERAHFSPGVIDGMMGGNTRRALRAYQSAHGLDATGEINDKTIKSLGGSSAPVLVRKTLSAEDVAGPFKDTPEGAEAMSKADAMPYESVEEKVAEQFHVTPEWLRERNPDVTLEAGTTLTVPQLDGAGDLPKPARVIVDESDKSLLLEDDAGKVIAHFPVTTGSKQFPLPIGDWKVTGVAPDPVWHFNPDLISGTAKDAESADIPPGPNNPVGVVWIDLSKEHYGIHGTPDPARIGKTASNGCIRMTNWSATAVSKVVSTGMPVVMRH